MPNEITIRFIMAGDIVSRLIGWTTDSLWCHTEALSRDGAGWIGAHSITGVQKRTLDWCETTREARYTLPVPPALYESAMTWLETKLAEPYDYEDIVGLALHKRIGVSDHEVICSALMTQFLQQAGHAPLNCLESYAYMITPETLHLSPIFIGRRTFAKEA